MDLIQNVEYLTHISLCNNQLTFSHRKQPISVQSTVGRGSKVNNMDPIASQIEWRGPVYLSLKLSLPARCTGLSRYSITRL